MTTRELNVRIGAALLGIAIGFVLRGIVFGYNSPRRPPHASFQIIVSEEGNIARIGPDSNGTWQGTFVFQNIEDAREGRIRAAMALTMYQRQLAD